MEPAVRPLDVAGHGLRLLAVADRALPGDDPPARREDAERDLTLLGLIAMFDPPRPEVADAVARLAGLGDKAIWVHGNGERELLAGLDGRVPAGPAGDTVAASSDRPSNCGARDTTSTPPPSGSSPADTRTPPAGLTRTSGGRTVMWQPSKRSQRSPPRRRTPPDSEPGR